MKNRPIAAALALAVCAGLPLTAIPSGSSAVAASPRSSHLTRYPYLTDVVPARRHVSATLNFATDSSVTAAFATMGVARRSCHTLRRAGSGTAIRVGDVAEKQWRVRFRGLRPGKRYCYRIVAGRPRHPGHVLLGTRRSSVFRTLPVRKGATFRFAVFGDWGYTNSRGTNRDQARLDGRIAHSGALFAVSTGDIAYPGGSQTNYGDLNQRGDSVSTVFGPRFYRRIGDGIPFYPALGNHGLSATTFLNVWPESTAAARSHGRVRIDRYGSVNGTDPKDYPSVWYAFQVGRARIYILDAAWADSNQGDGNLYSDDHAAHWRPGSAEYRWLSKDLRTHPRGLKIAVEHFPMYADNPTEGTDPYLHGPGSLAALLTRHHVRLVFNGHMHGYQRNRRHPGESFVSYVTGGGGATLESVGSHGCSKYDAYAIGWSPTKHKGSRCGAAKAPTRAGQVYHYLLVTVRRTSVTVAPTASTGRRFDVRTYRF